MEPPFVVNAGICPDTGLFQDRVFSVVSDEIPKYLGSSLSGVECQNSSGAKHRSCSGTKLNAGSRLHCPHRSRGLHPGGKLLLRLLRLIVRILIWASTDAQR